MNKWRALKAKAIFLFQRCGGTDAKWGVMDGKKDEAVPFGPWLLICDEKADIDYHVKDEPLFYLTVRITVLFWIPTERLISQRFPNKCQKLTNLESSWQIFSPSSETTSSSYFLTFSTHPLTDSAAAALDRRLTGWRADSGMGAVKRQ